MISLHIGASVDSSFSIQHCFRAAPGLKLGFPALPYGHSDLKLRFQHCFFSVFYPLFHDHPPSLAVGWYFSAVLRGYFEDLFLILGQHTPRFFLPLANLLQVLRETPVLWMEHVFFLVLMGLTAICG